MENKFLNKQRIQLIALIKKWKVGQPGLAAEMKMPAGTFKNKLHEVDGKYRFTEEEFMKLANVIDRMQADFSLFCNVLDDTDDIIV